MSSCPFVEFLEILLFLVLLSVGNVSTLLNHCFDLVITCNCSHMERESSALLRKFSNGFLLIYSKSIVTIDFELTLSNVGNASLLLACHVVGYISLSIFCSVVFTQAIGVRSRLHPS